MDPIDRLLRNNARYIPRTRDVWLPAPPAREVAIVTCMDARLNPYAMLGLEEGDAHVLRNAGGVVTEDVLRSLVISQWELGTRAIMLIHHRDCGMAKLREEDLKRKIEREMGSPPPYPLQGFASPEEDVRLSLQRIRACPYLPHKTARGFVYEERSGRLQEVHASPS